jgi:uncharacterized protein YajQ (UPF0234 family)
MPSFDIVSEVSSVEIENAVNQAKEGLATALISKAARPESSWKK